MKKHTLENQNFLLGVDYYPEHWLPSQWPQDARWMRGLGLDVIRLAEFSWAKLEPEEGRFEWDWLDESIRTLADEGLKIVLGTPTAAPPTWLSEKYPQTLPMDEDGIPRQPGGRRHYCPNSPQYRQLTRRLVLAMAERYGNHPDVIGWQIDNEFGDQGTAHCYCPNCLVAFQQWLQERYLTLDALNHAWGNVFWSQTFTAWEQIRLPVRTLNQPNPCASLDFFRFASSSVIAYQQLQIDALHSFICQDQFITHNLMWLYTDIDYFKLSEPLDFLSYDSYPHGYYDLWRKRLYADNELPVHYANDVGDPILTSFSHDLTRSLSKRPFWIMEQQAGHINWSRYNAPVRAGAVRLWTWHAAAAGAEAVVYFRERECPYAQEQYHSGLRHHDNRPALGYFEIEQLKKERDHLSTLASEKVNAKVGLMISFDDLWALQIQPHHPDFDYLRLIFTHYCAFQRLGLVVDFISKDTDLDPYSLIVIPSAHIGDTQMATILARQAQKGKVVLLGIRSGFKTSSNMVTTQSLPGVFKELIGGIITDWHSLPPDQSYPLQSEQIPSLGNAALWAEAILPQSKRINALARYANGPLQGAAAWSEHSLGKGFANYLGWHPSINQAMIILRYLAQKAGLQPIDNLPDGLLIRQRGPHTVLLNFTDTPIEINIEAETVMVQPRDIHLIS